MNRTLTGWLVDVSRSSAAFTVRNLAVHRTAGPPRPEINTLTRFAPRQDLGHGCSAGRPLGVLMKRSVVVMSAAPLAAAFAGIAPAASAAPAQIVQIHDVTPLLEVATVPECLDERLGSQTGTETLDGQAVVTGNTLNFHGTGTLAYAVTFDDGTVVTGTAVGPVLFHAASGGKTVQTNEVLERRDIVDASGNVVGKVTIHALTHTTYVDSNNNGQPDPGEFSSQVDRFFFTCH